MEISIVRSSEIEKNKEVIGNKTHNLKRCVDLGFNVPKFIALSSSSSKTLLSNEIARSEIAGEIMDVLPSEKYAVRSSALIEDNKKESSAGQFLTKTNVEGSELSGNIYEVLKQAEIYLDGDLTQFSIIIQEYISPDISGVTFTRNPNGNREMIIEYGFCEGEKIVSGEIKPQRISFYWNNALSQDLPELFAENQIIKKFKEIENKYGFPQDIEWCIRNDQFYILQTRPITTISNRQYEQILFLEKFLQKKDKYCFQKTEISEVAPRPTAITFDILHGIYSENGPVDSVYGKYGVRYQNTDFLKIIGNELYVDREKEIQGLLPVYSYYNRSFSPKISKFSKMLVSSKNLLFLNRIKTSGHENLFNELKTRIKTDKYNSDLEAEFQSFLKDYEIIFETNLLSGISIKKLNIILKNESINFPEIIDGHSFFISLDRYAVQCPQDLLGNSLEISSESSFVVNHEKTRDDSDIFEIWWKKAPEHKKRILQRIISEAIIYDHLRELGRWLAVKNINKIRKLLSECAEDKKFVDMRNIYFSSLKDIFNGEINEEDCIKKRCVYEKYDHFELPNSITSSLPNRKAEILGVSSGIASGILQTQETIRKGVADRKSILYTEILSPDLTECFDNIVGIISDNGGLLSHLAIMAREKKIPAIVGFSLDESKIKIGDEVRMDGSKGKVIKVE